MRITVELDESQLAAIQHATGISKKSPAVRQALQDYLAGLVRKCFLERVLRGETDYALTNAELEARGTYDPD